MTLIFIYKRIYHLVLRKALTCVAEVDHISFHFPVGPDCTSFGVFCDVAGGCVASSQVIVSCQWWMAFLIFLIFPSL
jgi:hypothetical protein